MEDSKENRTEESTESRKNKPGVETGKELEKGIRDHAERKSEEENRSFSMKFPKPRILTKNEYPDLKTPQPDLFKELINEIIYPEDGSARERYLQQTIDDLKERFVEKI